MASQQQSTICFLVEQACEDYASYQDINHQIIMFVRQNPKYFCPHFLF